MFAFEGRFAAAVSIVSGSSRLRPMGDLGIGPEYQGFMSADAADDDGARHVSITSHGPVDELSARRWKARTCPPCERILTHRRICSLRDCNLDNANRLRASESSHDDRHDAGRRGRRHHCHQAPTRHCAIDTPHHERAQSPVKHAQSSTSQTQQWVIRKLPSG